MNFSLSFAEKVKNEGTDKAYEKSRLVVKAYNDHKNDLILTQLPAIQQVSQRVIVCMAAIFQDNKNTQLYLRDIM